jgi:hypothetical protein
MLEDLVDRAFVAWSEAPHDAVVLQSAPILYFGDEPRFRRSALRVVTVAKNPSQHEFPTHDPWLRFRGLARQPSAGQRVRDCDYLSALNEYFRASSNPYGWFESLRPLLAGFGADFSSESNNVALHTDLLSPVATSRGWSCLRPDQQQSFAALGVPLWHDLIDALRPHVLLMSFPKSDRKRLRFHIERPWSTVCAIHEREDGSERTAPFLVEHAIAKLDGGDRIDLLFGQAAQKPWGTLGAGAQSGVGRFLRNRLANW